MPPDDRESVRVFLVDDHAVVRQGTHELLKRDPRLRIIGEFGMAQGLLEALEAPLEQSDDASPMVLLLDIHLPDGNGLHLLPEIKGRFPQLKIILFSAHGEIQYVHQAVKYGADGFLNKMVSETELRDAIASVASAPPGSTEPVLSADLQTLMEKSRTASQTRNLTAREQEILLYVAQGLTNQEIARQLCLSVKTVDTHLGNLMKKTGVVNRTQLLAYAYEHGLNRLSP